MNSTPPPSPSEPSLFRRHGCLIALVVIAVLLIGGAMAAYHAAVGTALPFRIIASMIEKANPNIEINGITGDLSSGVSVESITWGNDPKNPSEIRDLRIKYNGYGDARAQRRVVIHEIGVRKAHIDLADFGPISHTTTQTTSSTNTKTSASTNAGFPGGLSSFEIERVGFEDVLITDRNSTFRLAIPKVEWTGFKVTPTSADLGTLTVESDRLTLHTGPGRSLVFNGQNTAFQKQLTGVVLPLLHPAIKQPIPFTVDVSFSKGDLLPLHILAVGGKVEIGVTGTKDMALQVRGLDLASLFDAQKLFGDQAADLPNDLVLSVAAAPGATDGHGKIKVIGGHFRLGVSTFDIEPLEFAEEEQAGAILQAILKTDAGNIVWALPLAKVGREYHPHFISTGLPPEEILARVFAGRPYAELSAEEKQAVRERRPIYFPSTEK